MSNGRRKLEVVFCGGFIDFICCWKWVRGSGGGEVWRGGSHVTSCWLILLNPSTEVHFVFVHGVGIYISI